MSDDQISPDAYRVLLLTERIGQQAKQHAAELAEVQMHFRVEVQELQAEIERLKVQLSSVKEP